MLASGTAFSTCDSNFSQVLPVVLTKSYSSLKQTNIHHVSMVSGYPKQTVVRQGSLVFCRQAKVPKSNASEWSRWSVKSVFAGIFRRRCSAHQQICRSLPHPQAGTRPENGLIPICIRSETEAARYGLSCMIRAPCVDSRVSPSHPRWSRTRNSHPLFIVLWMMWNWNYEAGRPSSLPLTMSKAMQ